MTNTLAIGCAAGFGGDRVDAAGPVVETLIARGGPGFLIFETLAERTLALARVERSQDPDRGYSPLMEAMLRPVLQRCLDHGIPIVANFGAANPLAAARVVRRMALARVAVVLGDEIAPETPDCIGANAYIGAAAIADALRAGAQVVITGRVADPSLTVGPALAHFGWGESDWDVLARATMAGHLLECGAQVTGGYFADPGYKDVPDLANVGFPIVEMDEHGAFEVTKAAATGGMVDCRTVKEQLLYEIHDPAAYLTPDVVADISDVSVRESGKDRVAVEGVRGHARPDTLKVLAWYEAGWLGEGEISYAGPNAEARARLALEVLRARLGDAMQARLDIWGGAEVRIRVAGEHKNRDVAARIPAEVTALYTCGPAGGGGVRTHLTRRLDSVARYVPRESVQARFEMVD